MEERQLVRVFQKENTHPVSYLDRSEWSVAGSEKFGNRNYYGAYVVLTLTGCHVNLGRTGFGCYSRNRGVFGLNLEHLFNEREKVRKLMSSTLSGVEADWVRPYVGKTREVRRTLNGDFGPTPSYRFPAVTSARPLTVRFAPLTTAVIPNPPAVTEPATILSCPNK